MERPMRSETYNLLLLRTQGASWLSITIINACCYVANVEH